MSAAAETAPPEAAPSPPRRVTGAQLMRRMRSSAEIKRRLCNLRLIPPDGERCLRAVADLVAGAPDHESFSFDARLCPGGLAEEVAIHRKLFGPVDDIQRTLEALQRAELLVMDNATVRLVLPPEPAARVTYAADGTTVVDLPGARPPPARGRPRKGETPEEYRSRLHQTNMQRSLALPPTLVRTRADFPTTYESPPESARLSESPTFPISPDFPKSDFSPTFPLAVVVVDEHLSDETPSIETTPTPTTARASDFPGKVKKSDFSKVDFSGLDFSEVAEALAGEVIRQLQLRPGAATQVKPWIEGKLRLNVPVQLLADEFTSGFDRHRRRPIESVFWFEEPVAKAFAAWQAKTAPPHPAYAVSLQATAPPLSRPQLRNPFAEAERELLQEIGELPRTIEGECSGSG